MIRKHTLIVLFTLAFAVGGCAEAERLARDAIDEAGADGTEYETGQGQTVHIPLGARAFADRVASYDAGAPAPRPGTDPANPQHSLGTPDYDGVGSPSYVSIGPGGSLTVEFADNVLVDVSGPDLVVFEVGPAVESTMVSISEDGSTFTEVGQIEGGEARVDIGPVARPGARYTHVRLANPDRQRGSGYSDTPGPDIDAVAAIGAEAR